MVYMVMVMVGIFFFKQKTAYEMRISDWSSDVCSSDLTSSTVPPTAPCCARSGSIMWPMASTRLSSRPDPGEKPLSYKAPVGEPALRRRRQERENRKSGVKLRSFPRFFALPQQWLARAGRRCSTGGKRQDPRVTLHAVV